LKQEKRELGLHSSGSFFKRANVRKEKKKNKKIKEKGEIKEVKRR